MFFTIQQLLFFFNKPKTDLIMVAKPLHYPQPLKSMLPLSCGSSLGFCQVWASMFPSFSWSAVLHNFLPLLFLFKTCKLHAGMLLFCFYEAELSNSPGPTEVCTSEIITCALLLCLLQDCIILIVLEKRW